jgi:hypothetical protein
MDVAWFLGDSVVFQDVCQLDANKIMQAIMTYVITIKFGTKAYRTLTCNPRIEIPKPNCCETALKTDLLQSSSQPW